MHFVKLILSSLVLVAPLHALSSAPTNEISTNKISTDGISTNGISTNEVSDNDFLLLDEDSFTTDIWIKEAQTLETLKNSWINEAQTLEMLKKRANPGDPGYHPPEAFRLCRGVRRWPIVQYLFFPPRNRRIDVNMTAAIHGILGYIGRIQTTRVTIEVQVAVPLWNPDTGSFGVIITAWNRRRTAQRLVLVVEAGPPRGHEGPVREHRIHVNMPNDDWAEEECMIDTFGPHAHVKMYIWVENA